MALFGWLKQAPPRPAGAPIAASLGWMLDSFDVMLYALVLAHLMKDLGMGKTTAGFLGSLTLVASAAGGIVFGVLADKLGRTWALRASILIYSDIHGRLRLRSIRSDAGRFPDFSGIGHGRRMGERSGARFRDMARRTPRKSAGFRPELLGHRLCGRGARDRDRSALVRLARGFFHRASCPPSSFSGFKRKSKNRSSGAPTRNARPKNKKPNIWSRSSGDACWPSRPW